MMSRALKRGRRTGAMTIEFALIMVMGFMPIVYAMFDWTWYFWQASLVQTALWEAAHEGAAVDMALDCPDSSAENKLNDMLSAYNISGAVIDSALDTDTYGIGTPQSIDQLTLSVTVEFSPILGLVPVPANLGGTVTVPLEQQTGYGGC